MIIERTKNASRNVVFGLLQIVYQTAVPFAMRTIMIHVLGVGYLGLNGLFVSVLSVLNLAELGVGSAMIYSMYKPIVEDDRKTICALMNMYRKYYRIIGLVIAVAGCIVMPFIPKLIKGEVPPEVNLYVLFGLHLASTVLSYWLFAYKNCLLMAHQRIDVTNKVVLVVNTGLYLGQLFILIVLKNYYLYIAAALVAQAVINIVTAIVVDRMYPYYKAEGQLPEEEIKKINGRIRDLFTSKIGSVIINAADTIVISAFLGLTVLAIYQNYFYIMNFVIGIIGIITTSCMAGIGNSLIVESQKKNYEDLKKLTFIIAWLSGVCSAFFLCLYQPFMIIWVGQDLLLPYDAVICFCFYFYIYEMNRLLFTFKDAAGIWHEDRFRPLVTAMGNLIMNLIMVQFLGIYGIILSTVISTLFIGMPWLVQNLFSTIFSKEYRKEFIIQLIYYFVVSIAVCLVTERICNFVQGRPIKMFLIRGVLCCIIPNVLFLIIYYRRKEFGQCLELADKITKGKLHLKKRFLRG